MISVDKYFKIKGRMTRICCIGCDDCPLSYKNNEMRTSCTLLEFKYPEKAVAIIEQWGKEHPIKTYLSDFLEKYPKAKVAPNGIPNGAICPSDLGFEDIDKRKQCHSRCVECWNQELEEE